MESFHLPTIFKAHYTFNFLFITVFMKEKELTEYIVWDNGIMKLSENDRENGTKMIKLM